MTSERFKTLAEAYGADLSRWPELERAAAQAFLTAHPDEAGAILAAEANLDLLLDRAAAPAPSAVVRERIIALAPRRTSSVWGRGGAWVSGAGLAAACVLGVFVGANLSSTFLDDPVDTVVEASTAFDGTAYFDALENAG